MYGNSAPFDILDTENVYYNAWLDELAKEYPEMEHYKKLVNEAHSISPTLVIDGNKLFEKMDLEDYRIKRIIAIHYVTTFYRVKMLDSEICK